MTAVQPRQRDAFMLTPSLTDTRLMQPQAMSHQELSQQEVRRQHSIAEATQAHQPLAEIQEAFTLFDKDNSGGLGYRELKVALRALGFPVKKTEVQALIARHGDAMGNISRAAWEQICRDSLRDRDAGEQLARGGYLGLAEAVCRLTLPRCLCRAFQLFDVDADGKITVSDCRRHDDLLCTIPFNVSLACVLQVQDLRAVARELGQTIDEQDLAGMAMHTRHGKDLQQGRIATYQETFEAWREVYSATAKVCRNLPSALVQEAMAMGIPSSAIPSLPADATPSDITRAHNHLKGMIESFSSANI
eukprot:jgi/Astpho2/35/Aster-07488